MTTPEQALSCPMGDNDARAATVRDYLVSLLAKVWGENEGFSGKRPFGNSDWDWEIYSALAQGGLVNGTFDADGYLDTFDEDEARRLVAAAIQSLRSS